MKEPIAIKIRYRGKYIGNKWVYEYPKVVELPIPFVAKSEKVGEVICDPIGEFPWQDGRKLLDLSGPDGPFEFIEDVYPATENGIDHLEDEALNYGEGNVIEPPAMNQRPLNRWGRPILTVEERARVKKRINAAKLSRGIRQRAVRSDKGKPKPRTSAIVEVQPQAAEPAISEMTEGLGG